ncbi:MAG: DUF6398 domain-containing protein [Planctomycetota bacterium]
MGNSKSKAAQMRVPKKNRQLFEQIVELIDAFCQKSLDEDYRRLCEDMAVELCISGFSLDKGKPASWASAIVHAVGWVNFLQDPGLSPHMTSAQVAEGFGVSQGTMTAKSKIIRDELELIQLDPDWCTPAMLKDNPLVWMLEVNGIVMDIRSAPRGAQEEAYRLGLIPFIPADEEEPQLESDTEAKVIQFPSGLKETTGQKSVRKSTDDGPGLFGGLED